ncbi:hypothetical protein, partial [Nocardia carnea]|uniref:hypothetical protein n=1 Tax=Nocardia carnea TaxID=37328 RepID=UPI002458B014
MPQIIALDTGDMHSFPRTVFSGAVYVGVSVDIGFHPRSPMHIRRTRQRSRVQLLQCAGIEADEQSIHIVDAQFAEIYRVTERDLTLSAIVPRSVHPEEYDVECISMSDMRTTHPVVGVIPAGHQRSRTAIGSRRGYHLEISIDTHEKETVVHDLVPTRSVRRDRPEEGVRAHHYMAGQLSFAVTDFTDIAAVGTVPIGRAGNESLDGSVQCLIGARAHDPGWQVFRAGNLPVHGQFVVEQAGGNQRGLRPPLLIQRQKDKPCLDTGLLRHRQQLRAGRQFCIDDPAVHGRFDQNDQSRPFGFDDAGAWGHPARAQGWQGLPS